MGGSSPPFLYDPPSRYTFDDNFNPRAASQSSWAPRQQKPKQNGPLVHFNRHPDSYAIIPYGNVEAKPMSPHTKSRVMKGRYLQLFLRLFTLIGALGALFCVICIKGTTIPVAWIVRVAPAIATIHTLYAIYHLCRSPASRPPASSASYMLFAASVDAGLVPFYAFTAFLAHGEYTGDAVHWDTLFEDQGATYRITYATFLVSIINGGFHLVSMVLSIYLAVIFRQISKLPPDMNPLEDNLTSRHYEHNKSELAEKHLSQSTFESYGNRMSAAEEPSTPQTRSTPFMHTRQGSSNNGSNDSSERPHEMRSSQMSAHSKQSSRAQLPSQQTRLYEQPNKSNTSLTRTPALKARDSPSRPTSAVINDAPVLEPSTAASPEIRSGSPSPTLSKDNWFTYPSRSPSPVDDAHNKNIARRETSSVYSRATTLASSTYSGPKDWITSAERYDREGSNASAEDRRGEYEALVENEYYGDDEDPQRHEIYDDMEQDLGERPANISSDESKKTRRELPFNPLGMNPPTPKPKEDGSIKSRSSKGSVRRTALTDIPNPSVKTPDPMPPLESPERKGRFYGDLESKIGLAISWDASRTSETHVFNESKKGSVKKKVLRNKSGKLASYQSLKVHDDDSSGPEDQDSKVKRRSKDVEGDRKGRVVSNSGVDIGAGLGSGPSASYGSYIAGLGVGRRREVSGKLAEEGRGGTGLADREKTPQKPPYPRPAGQNVIRAAGWARFAGL